MDLSWIFPQNFTEFSIILIIALALDYIYSYHKGIMYRIHPVHTAYFMALRLYKLLPRTKLAGVMIWFIVVLTHTFIYALMLYLSSVVNRVAWIIVSVYILKVSISLRLLINHVYSTWICLKNLDVDCAREAIAGAVRRSVADLSEGHIASAAIETLFENIVDGFTSPLLYYLILGPLGALLQRLINTLDAALGYKVGDLAKVGWFSARVDDIVNYIPARLTMVLIITLCIFSHGSPRSSLMIYLRNGNKIESVNARTVISTASGCLRIRLEKLGCYSVGEEFSLPKDSHLSKALRLSLYVSLTYIVLMCIIALLIIY